MKHVLNHLIQLQELDFALAEQKAANPKESFEQLEEAIKQLIEKLPQPISNRYLILQKRFSLAVVPMVHGCCTGCGLTVPIALANDIRAAKQVLGCPNCGRFLYYREGWPERRKPAAQKQPPKAGIARFSARELMLPRISATTREGVIAELAHLMAQHGFVEGPDALAELALSREAMISTAVENGLAFPHVRNVEGGGLVLALGLKKEGLKFGAPDGRLTKIVFFMVIPTAVSAFYLKLLAGLVGTFSKAEARNTLLKCETPEEMWKALTTLTRDSIP